MAQSGFFSCEYFVLLYPLSHYQAQNYRCSCKFSLHHAASDVVESVQLVVRIVDRRMPDLMKNLQYRWIEDPRPHDPLRLYADV